MEVIEIAKSRRILEAIKRIVKSIVKAVAITYGKIAILRKKTTMTMRIMLMTRQMTISYLKSD